MKLFDVTLRPTLRLLIQAETHEDALALGAQEARLQYPGGLADWQGTVQAAPADVVADVERGLVKPRSLTCPRCGMTSAKSAWGPGYVRCPECDRCWPSAEEQRLGRPDGT